MRVWAAAGGARRGCPAWGSLAGWQHGRLHLGHPCCGPAAQHLPACPPPPACAEGAGEFGQEQGDEEERDTEPTPLRRRPQLRGPREQRPRWEGEGRQAPSALTPEQAKREREARQEAELVSKLQGMGAQVFLPAASGEIDWGVLAGAARRGGGSSQPCCLS